MGLGLRQQSTSDTSNTFTGSTTDIVTNSASPTASATSIAASQSQEASASAPATSAPISTSSPISSTSSSMSGNASQSGPASDPNSPSGPPTSLSTTTSSSSTTTTSSTSTTTSTSTSTSTSSTTTSTTSSSTTTTSTSSSTSSSSTSSSSSSSSSPDTSSDTSTTPSPTPAFIPTTTFSTTVFVTTTDSSGHTTTSTPTLLTSIFTSSSDGVEVTITATGANPAPTLSSSNANQRNSFFSNTAAVAGVSVLIGLSVTSILIFVLFYVRRRRRRVRIEHDTAVSATLAAAGFTRRALDDDIDDGPPGSTGTRYRDSDPDPFGTNRSVNHSAGSGGALEMGQRSSSHLSGRNSAYFFDSANSPPSNTTGNGFNPYAEYGYAVPMAPSAPAGQPSPSYNPPGSGPGYIPVPTAEHGNPVPGHSPGPSIGGGANLGEKGHGHNASAGSYEPLLGAFWASQGLLNEDAIKDEPPTAGSSRDGTVPTPPPRNPRRLIDSPSGTPSPLASSAGHPNKPNEDLLGLGAPQKETKKVFDDTSSVYSHNTVGDQLQANRITKARVKAGREGLEDASIFGDHEDYSKRVGGGGVLGVRNATDLDRARSVRSSLES